MARDSRRRRGLAETLALGVVVTGDQHAVALGSVRPLAGGGNAVQLVADAGHLAAEPLHRLDAQMTGRLNGRCRHPGQSHAGEADKLSQRPLAGEQSARIRHTFEVVLALFEQVVQFDEDRPGAGREVIAEVSRHGDGGGVLAFVGVRLQAGDLDARLLAETALRAGVELADRLDLVAEELQAVRVVGVGRIDVEDAAATAELARQLDSVSAAEAVVDQPAREFVEVECLAGAEDTAVARELGPVGDRLQECLKGGQDEARRLGGFELFKEAQALAGGLVEARVAIGRQVVPGGEDGGVKAGEAEQIGRPRIEIARVRDDDEERVGCLLGERGGGEAGGRSPRTVDGPGVSGPQRGQQFRETLGVLDNGNEIGEPVDGGRRCGCHVLPPTLSLREGTRTARKKKIRNPKSEKKTDSSSFGFHRERPPSFFSRKLDGIPLAYNYSGREVNFSQRARPW